MATARLDGEPAYKPDLFADGALVEAAPHYASLRELGPLVWLEAQQLHAVPRYAEARRILADDAGFCSGQGVALNDLANGMGAGRNTLMTDGELHDHLRKVLAFDMRPRALRSLTDQVDEQADAVISGLVERSRHGEDVEVVTDLARELPLQVVPDLVGWPTDEREHLIPWASGMFDFLGPLNSRAEAGIPAAREMQGFASRMAAEGMLLPGSLGAGVVAAAERGVIEAERVPPLIVGYLAPSLDTTINGIASLLWLLATHPDQWAALKADPGLVANAFNEALRLESPIRAFSRVTTHDTQVGELTLPEGHRVVVLYGSANRDEDRFADAERFDVTRADANEHLGFGFGVHSCAGQSLAKLETHALLRSLLRHVDRLELAGDAVRAPNNLINGWATLPVRLHSTSAAIIGG